MKKPTLEQRKRILMMLNHIPRGRCAVAARLEISPETASNFLYSMKKAGEVENDAALETWEINQNIIRRHGCVKNYCEKLV